MRLQGISIVLLITASYTHAWLTIGISKNNINYRPDLPTRTHYECGCVNDRPLYPVCGTDGRIYKSFCDFECVRMRMRPEIRVRMKGGFCAPQYQAAIAKKMKEKAYQTTKKKPWTNKKKVKPNWKIKKQVEDSTIKADEAVR